MKYLLALILLIPAYCKADGFWKHDPWTKEDTMREAAYLVLHVVDWGQTRNIVHRSNEDFFEKNPIIGNRPSIKRVDSYFAFTAIAHVAVSYVLPRVWREGFQYTTVGVQAGVVIQNNSIGLRVDF